MKFLKKSKKYMQFRKKFLEKLEKIKKSRDILIIFDFLFSLLIYGAIINLGLTFFGIQFKFVHILSLGAMYWFLENKIINLIRRVRFKK